MGTFCFVGDDRVVDKFKGWESITVELDELPSLVLFVSTALKDAAASAKECNLESSSGWGGVSLVGVTVMPVPELTDDLDDETPRMTGCE